MFMSGLLATFLPTIVSVGAGLGVALTSVLSSWGSHIDIGQVRIRSIYHGNKIGSEAHGPVLIPFDFGNV